jgi:hypothetical protein
MFGFGFGEWKKRDMMWCGGVCWYVLWDGDLERKYLANIKVEHENVLVEEWQ